MEPETDAEGGRVPVPPGPEAPKRWPWGRITAVVVVALVTITAFAIAVRQPNRPPSITDVSVSDDIAIAGASPTKLLFTAHATDPDGDALSYSWEFGDGGTGSATRESHAYGVPRWYTPVLTVSGGQGGAATNHDPLLLLHVASGPADRLVPASPPPPAPCAVTCVGADG